MKAKHEFDQHRRHRVVVGDEMGKWTWTQLPATLETHDGTYIAFSQYFDLLEGITPEKVYKLIPSTSRAAGW